MVGGQQGENIRQRGAEGGIVKGRVRKGRGILNIILLLFSVTFLSSVEYEHFYESIYKNP